jgi:hypothetical protein
MSIAGSDIGFVLSGGNTNSNPNLSLGGEASGFPLTGSINNLFNNVNLSQSVSGQIDYRCLYVFNNNATETLYGVTASVVNEISGGSSALIGTIIATDCQRVTVSGSPSGGSFSLDYDGDTVTANYDSVIGNWGTNLANSFNALSDLSGVVVNATYVPENPPAAQKFIFDITFEGDDDNRAHSLVTLDSNSLTGSTTISIERVVNGGPINAIPSEIPTSTTAPGGVFFGNSLSVGKLFAAEGFPVWVQRTTPAGSSGASADGFTLRIGGSPISV